MSLPTNEHPAFARLGDPRQLHLGDRVEVRNRFDGSWSHGFEIAQVLHGVGTRRYRIRRMSDGAVLPRLFEEGEIDSRY